MKNENQFIEQLKNKFGDDFDYSFVKYEGSHKKITLKCNTCGNFVSKIAKDLLFRISKENTCPYCKNNKIIKERQLHFIEKSKKIHNDKYDYSKAKYISSKVKVEIICPIHGSFYQQPNSHLMGHGCPLCKRDKAALGNFEFIHKSCKIHNNYYDYSKVKYINNHIAINIICPKHGMFYQLPKEHLEGKGCPICNQSHMEKEMCQLLEANNIKYISQKTFSWLKQGKYALRLDFYLPDHNIAIECQGEQHFKPIEYYGGENKYKRILVNDINKIKLCKNHNITVLHKSNTKNCSKKILKTWAYYPIIIDNKDLISRIKALNIQ